MSTATANDVAATNAVAKPLPPGIRRALSRLGRNALGSVQQFAGQLSIVGTIARWELQSFFLRPTAYVLLLATTLVAGWNFSFLVTLLSQGRVIPLRQAHNPIFQFLGPNIFLVFSVMLLVPIITMGSVADERRRGSWEALLTAPVEAWQVIVGKFVAVWCIFNLCWIPWLYFLLVLRCSNGQLRLLWGVLPWFAETGVRYDLGPLLGGVIGLMTLGATLTAIGLFCSTVCKRPFGAAVACFVAMLSVLLLSLLPRALTFWQFSATWIKWAERFSCWGHLSRFSQGIVDVRLVAGHVSLTVLVIWLTIQAARYIRD